MRRFHDLDAKAFDQFRVFFASRECPVKMAGPSGLYSSKLPTLDVLLSGKHLPEHMDKFLTEHGASYPKREEGNRNAARQHAAAGQSVLDKIHDLGDPESLAADYAALQATLATFRSTHMQAVVKFIPGLIEGHKLGTGGESVELLRARSSMHGDAQKRCPFSGLTSLIARFRTEGRNPHG